MLGSLVVLPSNRPLSRSAVRREAKASTEGLRGSRIPVPLNAEVKRNKRQSYSWVEMHSIFEFGAIEEETLIERAQLNQSLTVEMDISVKASIWVRAIISVNFFPYRGGVREGSESKESSTYGIPRDPPKYPYP
jgi:hypothetical protein